jgi:hypothetical protein
VSEWGAQEWTSVLCNAMQCSGEGGGRVTHRVSQSPLLLPSLPIPPSRQAPRGPGGEEAPNMNERKNSTVQYVQEIK